MSDVYEMIRQSMPHTVPFAKHTGIDLTEVGDGHATASLTQSPETTNHIGSIHAGALFTLAETAAGGAVAAGFAPFMLNMKAIPTDMSIQLQSRARGNVTATAFFAEEIDQLRETLSASRSVWTQVLVKLTSCEDDTMIGSFLSEWKVSLREELSKVA